MSGFSHSGAGGYSPRRRGRIQIPRLTGVPGVKAPAGWALTGVSIRRRGHPGVAIADDPEPAGEPPVSWPGTRPEWATHWALTRLGYQPEIDFFYRQSAYLGQGWGGGEVDFLLPREQLGFEVQGELWHYGLGTAKIEQDALRGALWKGQGLTVIFLDDADVLKNPIFYVREGLAHRDHSKLTARG